MAALSKPPPPGHGLEDQGTRASRQRRAPTRPRRLPCSRRDHRADFSSKPCQPSECLSIRTRDRDSEYYIVLRSRTNACSAELRKRVIKTVEIGALRREIAQRFNVNAGSAVKRFAAPARWWPQQSSKRSSAGCDADIGCDFRTARGLWQRSWRCCASRALEPAAARSRLFLNRYESQLKGTPEVRRQEYRAVSGRKVPRRTTPTPTASPRAITSISSG